MGKDKSASERSEQEYEQLRIREHKYVLPEADAARRIH